LPNNDGFTIAEEIRKRNPAIPISFSTAKVQTENVVKGFSIGEMIISVNLLAWMN
jgi:DNA-binding response OmpR family regulator